MAFDFSGNIGRNFGAKFICACWFITGFLVVAGDDSQGSVSTGLNRTDKMSDLAQIVTEKGNQYGNEHVLVVFDIDNTLLAMNQDLGSDQWFTWQNALLKNPNENANQRVVSDFYELLAYQREFFFVSGMHPPEADTPNLLSEIQEKGFKAIALTSRGPDARVATERELARNNMDFSKSAVGSDLCGQYVPNPNSASDLFTAEELEKYHLSSPDRMVSYSSGIYMTAGFHKGAMLLALLDHFNAHYKAIIFVDDHKRHCIAIREAVNAEFNQNDITDDDVDITAIEYTQEHPRVAEFQKTKSKRKVNRAFRRYVKTKKKMFPEAVSSQ